jgi:hypothetical protein
MTAFTYKGYGRIYTNPEHIQVVEDIIKLLDEFEWGYYPQGLVASWDRYPNVEYVGKFELNGEKFKEFCKKADIPVFIFDAGMNDYPSGYYPTEPLSKEEIKQLSYGELK